MGGRTRERAEEEGGSGGKMGTKMETRKLTGPAVSGRRFGVWRVWAVRFKNVPVLGLPSLLAVAAGLFDDRRVLNVFFEDPHVSEVCFVWKRYRTIIPCGYRCSNAYGYQRRRTNPRKKRDDVQLKYWNLLKYI
jgi:hypothetical protein